MSWEGADEAVGNLQQFDALWMNCGNHSKPKPKGKGKGGKGKPKGKG